MLKTEHQSKYKKIADSSITRCPEHKVKDMSYGEWQEWADQLHNKGIRQKQCPVCTRWLFPEEF
jgi:hypothetical protein